MLWGTTGVGKTTFAATAPGNKLWLSFGDQEHVSIMHRKDVEIVNLAELAYEELFKHGQNDNPFGLDSILADRTDIETVVVDSSTAIAFRALQKAVGKGLGASRGQGGFVFTPTMEAPGISAYGGRNAIVLETLTGLLKVTAKHNVHVIVTAHEADPKESNGIVEYITTMLGGQLVNNMAWRLSEIWYMSEDDTGARERRIAIRPYRKRKPMKTRMFKSTGERDFVLRYDADKPDNAPGQMTIAGWYDQWMKGHGEKLPVPSVGSSVRGAKGQ